MCFARVRISYRESIHIRLPLYLYIIYINDIITIEKRDPHPKRNKQNQLECARQSQINYKRVEVYLLFLVSLIQIQPERFNLK